MSIDLEFIELSAHLDRSGLIWHPEIGDEVSERPSLQRVSILVDPQGHTPRELREQFLWLPTVEQLVMQFEARQALIFHAGINQSLSYETVIKTGIGLIETSAQTLRHSFAKALNELLANHVDGKLH
jgi:hypothetical protein